MKFKVITESEYKKYWQKCPERCFLSAPEIAHLKNDALVFFLGVEDGGKLVAAAMIRGTKRRFSKYDFYAPRGILVDYHNKKLLKFFVEHIKSFLKKEHGYVFRMDPNVILRERDIDGKIVEGGEDNSDIVKNLQALNFKKARFLEGVSQVDWEFVLPVKGKTEEELLKDMKHGAKQHLKKATELGIKIKDLDYSELRSFYDVLMSTATRKSFTTRDFNYFEKMYRLFAPSNGVSFVSAVINPKESLALLEKRLEDESNSLPQTKVEKRNRDDRIKSFQAKIQTLKDLFPDTPDQDITISSGMFMTIQPEILHFLGGNDDKYMKLDGQYVLQWEMIKRALNQGYERYNFYGIPRNIDQHPANYGIYEFKRGFSGQVVELIGEYELSLSPYYYLANLISSLKSLVRH